MGGVGREARVGMHTSRTPSKVRNLRRPSTKTIMTKLEELKAVETQLYKEMKALEDPLDAKRSEWSTAFSAVQKAERFAELDQQYADEKLLKEQNGNA